MATNTTHLPTPPQLALAAVVLESKPDNLCVREYIAALRANIRKTSSVPPYQQETYLDGLGLWKIRCEQLEDARAALLAEVAQLQRRNEELCAASPKRSKRKASTSREAPDPCATPQPGAAPTKRVRLNEPQSTVSLMVETQVEENMNDWDLLDITAQGQHGSVNTALNIADPAHKGMHLSSHLYRIHRRLRPNPAPDEKHLAAYIVGACDSISAIVENMCRSDGDDNMPQLILPIGRRIRALLYAASKLGAGPEEDNRKARAAVVFAVISSLESVLKAISESSLQQAQLESGTEGRRDPGLQDTRTISSTSKLLMNLLLCLCNTDTLRVASTIHRDIFEGLAYLVLKRAATCLSTLVFGRRTDDAGKGIPIIHSVTEEVEHVAIAYESMHIAQLVDRIAHLSPTYLSPQDGPKLARSKSVKPDNRADGVSHNRSQITLHPLISGKLQRTLKDCMFPAVDGEHDEFMERLRMPRTIVLKEQKKMAAHEKDDMAKNTTRWFMEKMWCAVGWQILRHEED